MPCSRLIPCAPMNAFISTTLFLIVFLAAPGGSETLSNVEMPAKRPLPPQALPHIAV